MAALTAYLWPGLSNPTAHWPLWDVNVYRWAGGQVVHDAAVYAGSAPYHFTYPPFDAALFGLGGEAPEIYLKLAISAASACSLLALCVLSLGAAGVKPRPELVFGAAALALLTLPVVDTLHLGETDLIVTALVAADLLRHRDGGRWQGVAIGLAAAIKLTPLIFVVYLAATRRRRAAAVATGTFAATVAAGFLLLPADSRTFWLSGVFLESRRVGNTINLANQSLAGTVARLAGGSGAATGWWYAAAALTALAGIGVAVWAHRRGHRLAGAVCCGVTGLLVSPISWTHHWVWVVPLLVMLTVVAWRRRSLWCALAAATTGCLFSAAASQPSSGDSLGLGLLAENAYVLWGLAMLAGTALVLYRERAAGPASRWRNDGPGSNAELPAILTALRSPRSTRSPIGGSRWLQRHRRRPSRAARAEGCATASRSSPAEVEGSAGR
jgi:alpha-1,2-mannosyltransferase